MDFFQYVWLVITRAAQKSILLTDKLTILVVPFSTLVLWMAGAKMTDTIQETLAVGVAITVIVVVALRLVAASYLVWKADQEEKKGLRRSLAAPDRLVAAELKAYTTDRRKLLSEKLAHLSAIANFNTEYLPKLGVTPDGINVLGLEIDTLINQLSYDTTLRVAAIRLKEYCLALITGESADRERLWAQRKLTFRLLHCDDIISDVITLIEIEILTGEDFWPKRGDDQGEDLVSELRDSIKKLGDRLHDPAVVRSLRKVVRDHGESELEP